MKSIALIVVLLFAVVVDGQTNGHYFNISEAGKDVAGCTSLSMSKKGMTAFPAATCKLVNLQDINFSGNKITAVPACISSLTKTDLT